MKKKSIFLVNIYINCPKSKQ